jgi:hypothetical protein
MAESRNGVVVTERMLTEAARAGDLESLTIWAWQGVRVTSAEPLCIAAEGGHVEVLQCLVQKLGADVKQGGIAGFTALLDATNHGQLAVVRCLIQLGASVGGTSNSGTTALHIAALNGELDIVRYLVELGAEAGTADNDGQTALLLSAMNGRYPTMQYLLEEVGANMDDVTNDGDSVWDKLTEHFEAAVNDDADDDEVKKEDPAALAGLLRVMVLRGAPPPTLVFLLSPEPARVVQEGARLRARLPAYLAHRRTYLDLRCPRISLLPGVLRALIYGFEGPATTEELWATGLGTAP